MRSLEPEHYKIIAAIRRRTEALAAEEFRPFMTDPSKLRIHTMAIMSLGIDVARWYNPDHSPDPQILGDTYAKLVGGLLR